MLRTILIFCAMFMAVGTANAEPLKLTDAQMDTVTAGLLLPNGKRVLDNFDNPAPHDGHPSFFRSQTANDATTGPGPNGLNEGPWSAHFQSPVIGI